MPEPRTDAELRPELNDWEWSVYRLIDDGVIPPGFLISYGRLNRLASERIGVSPGARQIARLRRKLYGLLTHQTSVPLHRIAKKGDVHSLADSVQTRAENNRRRGAEGSLTNPKWI